MTRSILLALFGALAISLAGCGGDDDSTDDTTDSGTDSGSASVLVIDHVRPV